MKKPVLFLAVILCVVAAILTACGEESNEGVEPGIVPNDLQAIEAAAEDIIDFAPSGNWNQINKDITDIAEAWNSHQPQASEDGISEELQDTMTSAIEKLQTSSAAKDPAATMQGSNDVSAAVVEMFAVYNPKIPADIGRLDVLERQVILDVAAKDYAAAIVSLAKTKSVWEKVKPSVLEHDGKDVAAEFEASLAEQESALKAKDGAALTDNAKNGLETVDALEQLY